MRGEDFWDLYLNSKENTLDIYDEAIAFFSAELPEGFQEEYDAVEAVLEIQENHWTAKKFDKVINFVNLIRDKHPDIYEETSVFSDVFLIKYYVCQNKIDDLERIFEEASKNVENNYDFFLPIFKVLLFYQHINIAEKAVDPNFEAVSSSEDLISGAEYDLIILKLFNSLEKHYLQCQAGIAFEKEKVLQDIQKYTFDFKEIEKSIALFEKGLFEDSLDAKSIQKILEKNKSDALHILQAMFVKSMLQKNFRFAVSSKIWELMMRYWNKHNEKSRNYFAIETKKFDKFLVDLSGSFFSDNEDEIFAVLWGGVYIYDFLYAIEMIDFKTHNDFIKASKGLKGTLIANKPTSLWEFDFVHRWQKADSVSEIEFTQERKIFEKSLNYSRGEFSDFKLLIASELEAIGELSGYIIREGELAAERFGDRINNSKSFFDGEEDFFIPPSNLKPIVKDINEKIGRNDPCHCGSSKKFKKCCMN